MRVGGRWAYFGREDFLSSLEGEYFCRVTGLFIRSCGDFRRFARLAELFFCLTEAAVAEKKAGDIGR